MPDIKELMHVAGPALNIGMGVFQVAGAHKSSSEILESLNAEAQRLGYGTIDNFAADSSLVNVMLPQLNTESANAALKAGGNLGANLLPGGIITGMAAGSAVDGTVDSLSGRDPYVAELSQNMAAAIGKIQSGQKLDANDVASILKLDSESLNDTAERTNVNTLKDMGYNEENQNIYAAYDKQPSVRSKAEQLIGRYLDIDESPTQAIANYLVTTNQSPLVLWADNPSQFTVSMQPMMENEAQQVGQPQVAASDPLSKMGYTYSDPLTQMGYEDSGQLQSPRTPPKKDSGLPNPLKILSKL